MGAETTYRNLFTQIFGFACSQGFLFFLLFMTGGVSLNFEGVSFQWADLLLCLLSMIVSLALLRFSSPSARITLLSPGALYAYAALVVLATVLPFLSNQAVDFGLAAKGALVGFPSALLFCAWGKVFGDMALDQAFYVIIRGSLCGALACFFLAGAAMLSGYPLDVLLGLLPLGSASALSLCLKREVEGPEAEERRSAEPSVKANDLSARVLLGTVVFGFGAGVSTVLMGTNASGTPVPVLFALLLFALLAVVALQLFALPALGGANAQTVAKQLQFASPQGALAYVYRLAVLLVVAGYLLAPVLQTPVVNSQTMVITGYLSLVMALVMIFLARAVTTSSAPLLSFSLSFGVFFLGDALGVGLANGLQLVAPGGGAALVSLASAGVLMLVAFMFLFTENDLQALSVAAEAVDYFDEACDKMAADFGLSKREAEILPLALKGRTNERIAEQFVISKSTVDTHMRRIYSKCGVHSRQELIDLGEEVAEGLARQ